MSSETNKSWMSYAIVIGLCAAIGFIAVYAISGGGDNQPGGPAGPSATATSPKAPPASSGSLANTASDRQSETPAAAQTVTAADASKPSGTVLTGADGKPLNRGAMTTFVFKKQAMKIDKPPTFNGPDGKPVTMADFKGKVVLLNLWATWCAPCRKEMPHLNELQQQLGGDQFEVVALSVDRGSDKKPKDFLAEVGATALKFYHDPSAKAGFSFMAIGMPTTLLFDREGREIGRLVGPAEWHSDDAKNLIRAAIAAS